MKSKSKVKDKVKNNKIPKKEKDLSNVAHLILGLLLGYKGMKMFWHIFYIIAFTIAVIF